jgi:hypothetical protein
MKPLPRMTSISKLERLALDGSHGRFWYAYAESEIAKAAELLDICPRRFADILAITSPRVSVRKNIGLALQYISDGSMKGMLPAIKAGLRHYETTGEIRGSKTSAFARACSGDLSAVVLDTWMAVAFDINPKDLGDRPRVHREACRRVRAVARRLGWEPAEVQAAIWTAVATLSDGEKRGSDSDKRYRNAPQMSICEHIGPKNSSLVA